MKPQPSDKSETEHSSTASLEVSESMKPIESIEQIDRLHGTGLDEPSKPLILFKNRGIKPRRKLLRLVFPTPIIALATVLYLLLLCQGVMTMSAAHWNAIIVLILSFVLITFPLLVLGGVLVYMREIDKWFDQLEPVLELYPEGFRFNYSGMNFELIPWAEIRNVSSARRQQMNLVTIDVEPERLLTYAKDNKSRRNMRWLIFLRKLNRLPSLSFSDDFCSLDAEEICSQIDLRRQYHLKLK